MKVLLSTIEKYTKLKLDQKELLAKIAGQIGAIEHIEDLSKKYGGVIVGQIKEKSDHPNADKLSIYKLNIGRKTVQVVAGDKTLKIGDMVAYFAPGTKVSSTVGTSDELIVKKMDLRGVPSEGMMASEKELDLGANHEQVMRLDGDVGPGDNFADAYGLNTLAIDIENKALANRGDCFGAIGIAREVSGIQGLKFETPVWMSNKFAKVQQEDRVPLQVRNEAGSLCPRYMAVVMDNIGIKDSPVWLKAFLSASGVRPINNIVDLTNYFTLLTSQPLHAFDYDKVIGKDRKSKNIATIVVRPSKAGEKITTLDGKTVELADGVIVIADSENPIGIAGIMGGLDTEIDSSTKRIIIECANFDRYSTRRSSMQLGLFTEAATRFTKAQSPEGCDKVLAEATRMIGQLTGGKVASKVIDDYTSPANAISVKVSIPRLNGHLGADLSAKEVTALLENIGYTVKKEDADHLIVHVPPFRKDVAIPQDVNEDVGRQYGYNNIKPTLPTRSLLPAKANEDIQFKNRLRQILSSNGLNEILTYNFVGKETFSKAGISLNSAYHIKNALSPELEYMRYSLLPSLLEKTGNNEKERHIQFGLYEINVGHSKEEFDDEKLPLERWLVSGSITTPPSSLISGYYQTKVYIDLLASKLGIIDLDYSLLADTPLNDLPAWIQRVIPIFDMNRSAIIYSNKKEKRYIGIVGEAGKARAEFSVLIAEEVGLFELDIKTLQSLASDASIYREPSRYPSVTRDLCFAVAANVPYGPMENELRESLNSDEIIATVAPLDIYQDKSKPKQVTFRVTLQHIQKTLQPRDIQNLRDKAVKKMSKKFAAKLV